MKRVFIIHGLGASPDSNWFSWLKDELEHVGYEVEVPVMPNTNNPRTDSWISKISEVVGKADKDTYFVGHSLGCLAIVKYIETLPRDTQIGGAIFVAGFFFLSALLSDIWSDYTIREIYEDWSKHPVDFNKVRSHLKSSIAIFSDNDPWVPLENGDVFSNELNSKVIVEHNAGHLTGGFEFTEFHHILDAVLEII